MSVVLGAGDVLEAILGQEAARCEDLEDTRGELFAEGEVDSFIS